MDWNLVMTTAGVGVAIVGIVVVVALEHRKAKADLSYANDFRIQGSEWLAEKGISYEVFLRRLIGLDYVSTAGLEERSEGTVAQWAPVFRKSPETWAIVVYRDEVIVGYWSFFSLSDELVASLAKGELFDSGIEAGLVHELHEDRRHSLYVVMIAQQPEFVRGRRTIFKLLIQSLAQRIASLTADGVIVDRIYANAFTDEGRDLCESLGFQILVSARQGGAIYTSEMTEKLALRLRRFAHPTAGIGGRSSAKRDRRAREGPLDSNQAYSRAPNAGARTL